MPENGLPACDALPSELIDEKMTRWWIDPSLKPVSEGPPAIDYAWDWNGVGIEYEGRELAAERVGVLTGDGEVQGAMLISTEPVRSRMEFGAAALLCLSIGFWTSGAARNFRRVVESKNEDVWHLMNALRRLHAMYSLIRTIILGTLVLAIVGLVLLVVNVTQRG